MRINAYRGLLLAVLLAVVLAACGGEADEPDQADGDATDETENEDGDAGEEDEQSDDAADEEQEDTEAEEAGAGGFEWDPDASLRVTYRYEAEFDETDGPVTMIVAREDGRQSMQLDQGDMRAHIYTDAEDPFVCTAEGDRGWECYAGGNQPVGSQFELIYLGQHEELVAAFEGNVSQETIAGREAVCTEVSRDDFDGEICADTETGLALRSVGTTPDGQMSAEATDVGQPRPEDFEAPAEVQDMGM